MVMPIEQISTSSSNHMAKRRRPTWERNGRGQTGGLYGDRTRAVVAAATVTAASTVEGRNRHLARTTLRTAGARSTGAVVTRGDR